jgi:hypothetical protein
MKRFRMPSPALLVGVLALVAALAGTAIAGPGAVSSKLNKAKVKQVSQKQATKVLNKEEPTLDVASAVSLGELEYVQSNVVTVPDTQDGSAIANCPPGKFATGGGGGWEYRIRNGAGVPRNIRAYVICASAKATTGNYAAGDPAP